VILPQTNPFPQHQNPSAGVHILSGQSTIIFLTINTEKRVPWLANAVVRRLLHQTWSEAIAWLVGDYLLMPDHLHLFCAPRDFHFTIETWISDWKREFIMQRKRRARTLAPPTAGQRVAGAPHVPEMKFPPRGWDHRLREGEKDSEKWL
jgi:putative transposase